VRGAGNATRQINHIVKPEFPAERLLVVEVFTPPATGRAIRRTSTTRITRPARSCSRRSTTSDHGSPRRSPSKRSTAPRTISISPRPSRDGDLMLVPYGYHTTAAAHGYDLYYLNALAGDRRSMAAADDPALHWCARRGRASSPTRASRS
jgi:5-deoxy-glucuronate isomerase